MPVYCISYDLKSNNYESLIEAIKSYGVWWHQSESTWFIETSQTATEVTNQLKPFLYSNDKLITIEVKKHWAAVGHNEDEYSWLKNRTF